MSYLPYEEPGITVILSLTSFIVLLNGIRYTLDKLLHCGLVGEIVVGVIWGLPVGGTAWLSRETQKVMQNLGYLGLIGLVFEGGLSTSASDLRKAMLVSVSVATVGLFMPIALSFLLLLFPFKGASGTAFPTPLAAFSAGASLCSTSLGTTFAILSSANMQKTRAGVVLVGAAMMDDVVGLVMVNIVTTLGGGTTGTWPIARPIVASFGLLLTTLFFVPMILKPAWTLAVSCAPYENGGIGLSRTLKVKRWLFLQPLLLARNIPHLAFILPSLVLIAFITIASFIDTSVLFAAFLAGGTVNYLGNVHVNEVSTVNVSAMYDLYFRSVVDYVFVPLFFASIGFSVPISTMFTGSILWKGVVYTLIMTGAKAATGTVLYLEYFIQVLWTKRTTIQLNRGSRQRPIANGHPHNVPHTEALLVACAMVARGEIGFLIASLSESHGTFILEPSDIDSGASSGDDLFLVIVWAVGLCTILGPASVGVIVKTMGRHSQST